MNSRGKRRSSREYRDWDLEQWCQHVRSLGVQTLTQWAVTSRGTYNRAVMMGIQRKIARRLGWLPKLEKGEMYCLTDHEFADRFRQKGVKSVTDLWRSAQHWCEFLRKEGRLGRVAALLGFGYVQESHPNTLDYYLKRCERVGDLAAWKRIDKNAAEAARKYGLMAEIERRAPRRPTEGYPTYGGSCESLAELAVARLLEANGVPFITQVAYPFTFPRGKKHKSRCDFYLSAAGAFVEVWAVDPGDESDHWRDYQVRRRFKQAMCERLNLRLLDIEGCLFYRKDVEIFQSHVAAVLEEGVRLSLSTRLTTSDALSLEPIGDRFGSG